MELIRKINDEIQPDQRVDFHQIEPIVNDWRARASALPKAFSHGDLWFHNIVERGGKYYVTDWGTVALLPIGFDLGEAIANYFIGKDFDRNAFHEFIFLRKVSTACCRAKRGMRTSFKASLHCILTWLLPNHVTRVARQYRKNGEMPLEATSMVTAVLKLTKALATRG